MIKKMMLLTLALGMMSACAGTPDTKADEAKLKADSGVWFEKYNAGDADGVANLYAEDAVVLPDQAPATMGRAAFRTFIAADIAKSKAAGMSMRNGDVTGVGVAGDTAWVSGTFSLADGTGMAVSVGKYLSVYKRVNGAWLYARDTWNMDAPPAPPEPEPAAAPAKKGSKLGPVGRIFHR